MAGAERLAAASDGPQEPGHNAVAAYLGSHAQGHRDAAER